jgi:23S rRNA A1618 N6-methylase RlmF
MEISQEGRAKRRKGGEDEKDEDKAEEADEMARGHPLSLYTHRRPDFAALARVHAPLRRFLPVDFGDPAALTELTRALLLCDFDLSVTLPPDRLCPTVPSRLNYVLFVRDLLSRTPPHLRIDPATSSYDRGSFGGEEGVLGLDIGCGASCIYGLLGSRLFGWRFVCSELDPVSLDVARANAAANGMAATMRFVQAPNAASCIRDCFGEADELPSLVMCNPPFFEDAGEAAQHPGRHTVISASEAATAGGEAAFVGRIVAESLVLRRRVRLYSALCGRKSSLKPLRRQLVAAGVPLVHERRLVQGRTHRWVLAWSFCAPPFPLRVAGGAREAFERAAAYLRGLGIEPSPCDSLSLHLAASLGDMFAFEFAVRRGAQPEQVVATTRLTSGDREAFAAFEEMLAEHLEAVL